MDVNSNVDYGPQLNAIVWLLVSVSGLFMFTRLYLKTCQNRGLWWDDYILLASWFALTAQASLISYVISLGYGKKRIPLANLPFFGLPVNVLSTLLIIANLWGKTSFAVTLLRIPVHKMRVCVWYVLLTLTLTLTVSVVSVWVECNPFKLRQMCIPVDVSMKYNIFSCVYSAIMDVALALLPWKYLMSLQMSRKEKFGVLFAMSLGVLAGGTAAVKAATVSQINGPDARASIPLVTWGTAEAAVCIMAASIPILRALARGFRMRVPRGYETGYPATMVESSVQSSTQPSRHGQGQADTRVLPDLDRNRKARLSKSKNDPGDNSSTETAFRGSQR